jgi:CubicO group peptidase (beta-lactamase class C family)
MKKRLYLLLIAVLISLTIFNETPFKAFASAGNTPSGIPFSEMPQEIDNYVSKYIGKTAPGAAIAVVKDGKIIFSKGYGNADVENKTPVDAKNTVFEWGSISKLCTWVSVMQLVEQGKLDLDTDIKTYLPQDFSNKLKYTQPITMRDIMNHSAGFGDYAFDTIVFSPNQTVTLKDALIRDTPEQYYKVGTASAYSNYATALAGFVVECISKEPFADYEQNYIFNTLSMSSTTAQQKYNLQEKIIKSKSQGYYPTGKGGFVRGNWSYLSLTPAGAINGTAEDLARFAIALTPAKGERCPLFKNLNTLHTIFEPSYKPEGTMVGTAHGFFEYSGEYRTLGHGGDTAAFASQFAVVPEERFGIVILTNAKQEMDIRLGLQELLIGKKNKEITSASPNLPSTSQLAGSYVPFEREEGNFLNFSKYLSLYKIKSTGKNQISMNIGPYQGNYIQTKPYYYELKDYNNPIFANVYSTLKFELKNGKVSQINVGHGQDLSALPKGRTMPFLICSLIVLLCSVLYFTVSPVAMAVKMAKSRRKNLSKQERYFNLFHFILILSGTFTILNNIICVVRILIINNFRTFAEMKIHIILNYIFLIPVVLSLSAILYFFIKSKSTKKQKVFTLVTSILIFALFVLLTGWNFFNFV